MKAALLIVLSLSAVAFAGPAFNKNNQIDSQESYLKQQQMTNTNQYNQQQQQAITAKGPIVDILKQWCFSSQMSQQELTGSFKKLVSLVKSSPLDQSTEQAVMSERICAGVKSSSSSSSISNTDETMKTTSTSDGADVQAHELIKDVYMDALIACKSRDCTKQLLNLIEQQSDKIDNIRASYYMTRLAVTEKDQIKSLDELKQLVDSFISNIEQSRSSMSPKSELVERQKLFAVTSMVGKYCQDKPEDQQAKQMAHEVAKTIVERYVKPCTQQEVQEYIQKESQQQQQVPEQLIKKIAKRNAALKALANLPGFLLKEIPQVEEELLRIVQQKSEQQELVISRQSAIECLEQNEKVQQVLKQICFDQEEPIVIRIAAYRSLISVAPMEAQKQEKQIVDLIDELVKHCERNHQQDDQFCLYVISHLDNLRTSQQPEHKQIKECLLKNKQHYMQIQVLCKKFKQQLSDVRRSSRNYKLEQEFNQIESGLIIEGDLIYESKQNMKRQQQQPTVEVLPKLIRVNMSMPVMGETVNVVEISLRQNQMDEEILSALKLVEKANFGGKFNSQTVSKVVDSFKSSVEKQQQRNTNEQNNKPTEADLCIKVDGTTIVYLTIDDFKTSSRQQVYQQHPRQTRSIYHQHKSTTGRIVEEVIAYLKRSPVSFNRGINFSINERFAKLLDLDVNVLAGLRFESRVQGHSSDDFELVVKSEPRFNFEAIVGPAKMSSKKLLQRLSTKTAMAMRLRFKRDELVDIELDLPMKQMELFTIESQIVEKTSSSSYNYLPESIYGSEDIYSVYPVDYYNKDFSRRTSEENNKYLNKRSIFANKNENSLKKLIKGKSIKRDFETSEKFARATGLRGKLRFLAAPKDMSFIVSCLVVKYEPSMQGVRIQIEKQQQQQQQVKSYIVRVSTPGSRLERQLQLVLYKQHNSQRTSLKSDIQMSMPDNKKFIVSYMTELVHDGRQYSIKSELVSRQPSGRQWRHFIETGVMVVKSSPMSFAYKPYVQLESTSLKRPIQLQGSLSYVQNSPKTVISYELKCSTSSDYIQGKLIVDQRESSISKRFVGSSSSSVKFVPRLRRSMSSPLELVLSKDLTLTNELIAQVRSHAVKVHNMIDWSAHKISLNVDCSTSYKNLRYQQQPSTTQVTLKLDAEQQIVIVERKNPQEERKNYRAIVKSEWRAPSTHQMLAELRYQSRRMNDAMVAYKHKIDINKLSPKQYDCQMEVETIATVYKFQERFQGRVRLSTERRQKMIQLDLGSPSRQQQCKLSFDYQSLKQHELSFLVQTPRLLHKCELRNNQRQFLVSSRTEKQQQPIVKVLVDLAKPEKECKLIVEVPTKRCSVAVDLKLASGKRSSIALQTKRFVSQGDFSFDTIVRGVSSSSSISSLFVPKTFLQNNFRFRQSLKDLDTKQNYWMDSSLNGAHWDKETSYFRFESPIHRADFEFDPRSQLAKIGAFARSKRSISTYDNEDEMSQIYSNKYSALNNFVVSHKDDFVNLLQDKLSLNKDKVWMMRALLSSPFARDQLKQQARRALVQYIDRAQQHKHSFEWSPMEQSVQFDLNRLPAEEQQQQQRGMFEPMRLRGDLSSRRPSQLSLKSSWMDGDLETSSLSNIFDHDDNVEYNNQHDDDSYAKLNILSRHRRSPFKKHESEWRFNKKEQQHKAWMKHIDSDDKRHELRAQSERDPKKWAKVDYESDKHGKANWEHKWRKHTEKRSNKLSDSDDSSNFDEDVYNNKIQYRFEKPTNTMGHKSSWMHEANLDWQEPIKMLKDRRHRRSIINVDADETTGRRTDYFNYRYSPVEYLKHTSARLQSSFASSLDNNKSFLEPSYKLDFDYKPQLSSARLDVRMPNEMVHQSSFDYKPTERLYKLTSKLYNRLSPSDSTYDFSATTKPYVASLASPEQEPIFVHSDHPMLERPISTNSIAYKLFKQPMKLDYTDKYGRVASFDYDQLPLTSQKYAGLRQKRAAILYKDPVADFEHSSSYDFYPETFMGRVKPSYINKYHEQHMNNNNNNNNYSKKSSSFLTGSDDVVIKTQTKYGPIMVRADTSDVDNMQCELQSPLMDAKLTAVTGANMRKLIKFHLDNKSQTVKLAQLIRKAPESIRNLKVVEKIVRKVDSNRFEHDTELLVSLVDAIFKVKSETNLNSRQIVVIDGEWNQKEGKAYAKINGERVNGQCVVDLMRKQAEFVLDAKNKRTGEPIHHVTRLVRTSDNYYTLESTTTYKSRPIVKLAGKISSMIFEEPSHLFASSQRRRYIGADSSSQHVSTFEAVVYEPKQYHVTGMFDCEKKEARIVTKCVDENKFQETTVRFDENTKNIVFDSRLSSAYEGQIYLAKAKLNLPGLFKSDKCYYAGKHSSVTSTCSSEVIYEDKSGYWTTKYQPSEYIAISTPRGKQTFKLNY